mmetsp:Transcript_29022/g.43164  ORF Transcript_29022/g.43164 Transcript_29022/m.43164 type:complete len:143 (-) Transcript_29022:180-608(-)
MTSRLISLLRLIPHGGGQVLPPPNSWALVSLWRRFFQMQEEEREEAMQIMAEALEKPASVDNARPTASDEAYNARMEFLKEHYRALLTSNAGTMGGLGGSVGITPSTAETTPTMQRHENQQVHNPNLDIPTQDGQSYVTLAQ